MELTIAGLQLPKYCKTWIQQTQREMHVLFLTGRVCWYDALWLWLTAKCASILQWSFLSFTTSQPHAGWLAHHMDGQKISSWAAASSTFSAKRSSDSKRITRFSTCALIESVSLHWVDVASFVSSVRFLQSCYNLLWQHHVHPVYPQLMCSFLTVFKCFSSSCLTIVICSNSVTSAHQQHNVLVHPSFPKTRAQESIWLHLPLTYPPPLSLQLSCLPVPLWTVFSEHCSNTELAINHIALSRRRASPRALPAQCAPTIGRWGSLAGLSERDIGAIVYPASFLGAGDWEWGSPWTVNHAASCAPRIQCCSLRRAECGATRRAAYQQRHTGAG